MGMISAFILLQFLYSPSFGQVHGDKELLLLIMNGHRENIERISSWRGQALIRLHTEGRGADKRDMLSRAEFVYDGDLEATRWSWGLVEDKAENADGTKWENSKYFKNGMIKEKQILNLGPVYSDFQKRPYTLVVDSFLEYKRSNFSDDFDPMYYLNEAAKHMVPFPDLYENPESFPKDYYISREGDLVALKIVPKKNQNMFTEYIYDISQGCNLVSYFTKYTDHNIIRQKYEYEKAANVFVLKKVVHHTENQGEKPQVYHQEIEFTNTAVNEPVDPLEFSLEKLGVKPGDHINNRLLNLVFQYQTVSDRALDALEEALPIENLATNQIVSDSESETNKIAGEGVVSELPTDTVSEAGESLLQSAKDNAAMTQSDFSGSYWKWIFILAAGAVISLAMVKIFVTQKKKGLSHDQARPT